MVVFLARVRNPQALPNGLLQQLRQGPPHAERETESGEGKLSTHHSNQGYASKETGGGIWQLRFDLTKT
jgi:hypothetical protein